MASTSRWSRVRGSLSGGTCVRECVVHVAPGSGTGPRFSDKAEQRFTQPHQTSLSDTRGQTADAAAAVCCAALHKSDVLPPRLLQQQAGAVACPAWRCPLAMQHAAPLLAPPTLTLAPGGCCAHTALRVVSVLLILLSDCLVPQFLSATAMQASDDFNRDVS